VAIRKKVQKRNPHPHGPAFTSEDTMPVMSYQNPGLADLIVKAWANGPFNAGGVNVQHLGTALMDRDPHTGLPTQQARDTAKAAVNTLANLALTNVVVISEAEHDDDYTMQDDDEVVFVLPNDTRVVPGAGPNQLLETAKLLMACTPNGI
jgi:hypothetical protein